MGDMLTVKDLRVTFLDNNKEALHGISFTMQEGERLGLVGESGSGKTVTAMAITGLIERSRVTVTGDVVFECIAAAAVSSVPSKDRAWASYSRNR